MLNSKAKVGEVNLTCDACGKCVNSQKCQDDIKTPHMLVDDITLDVYCADFKEI